MKRKTIRIMFKKVYFVSIISLIFFLNGYSQEIPVKDLDVMDYRLTREYEIAGIEVTGIKYLNADVLAQLSGLRVGQKIEVPGEEITKAVKKYWKQGLFSDVKIYYDKIEENKIFIKIYLKERPRLASVSYKG